jgi:hypothetical protein
VSTFDRLALVDASGADVNRGGGEATHIGEQVRFADLRPTSAALLTSRNSDSTSDSPALAAAARQRRPSGDGRPVYAGARGKVEQSHPCRDDTPLRAIGGRRRNTADDYPAAALWRRILDQLPQTPNQDPQRRTLPNRRGRDHAVAGRAATQAALGGASGARPEPLRTSASQRRSMHFGKGFAATPTRIN